MRTFVALAALLLLAPLVDAPARADELGKAWKLLEAGDRERAKETAAVSLAGAQNAAERGEAFFILALCEPDGRKFAKYMEQFLSDFPGHPLTWRADTNLGMYHYALGSYGRASKHFRKASGLRMSRREEVQSLYWLGLSLLGGGKPG
ncbi:MAG: hypothetical protein JSW03_08205 [Candidatus Eiseniibacteriota bacterium]|nr:MAG: hypothetical protein JSW03_08205 [Candidatus Eisenbacteria bacterium]